MKNNNKAFSMVELLVSIVVASIMILTIGILSSISNRTYHKLDKEQTLYNDISYGLKLIQNKVRSSITIPQISPFGGSWASQQLVMTNYDDDPAKQVNFTSTFGLQINGSNRNFVYIADYTNNAWDKTEIILSLPNNNDNILTFTSGTNNSYKAEIKCPSTPGNTSNCKDKIDFDISTTITRRSS